jgi:hypothetical protein
VRALLDLVRENRADVNDIPGPRNIQNSTGHSMGQAVLGEAYLNLKILSPDFGRLELISSLIAELPPLKGFEEFHRTGVPRS